MKNNIKIILLSAFFFLPFFLSAQQITIRGTARTYIGDSLSIWTNVDYITNERVRSASCLVDSLGNFELKYYSNKPREYHMPLGVFEGIFYASPGDTLVIILPIKTEQTKEDSLNPYFRPEQHYLRSIEADGKLNLSKKIRAFDIAYFKESELVFKYFRGRVSPVKVDSAVTRIDEMFPNKDNDKFFEEYKCYKYLIMRHIAYNANSKKFIEKHFTNRPILYHNPTYNKALNLTLGFYLDVSNMGSAAKVEKASRFWQVLNENLSKKSQFQNDRFREYVLLMNLYRIAFKSVIKRNFYIDLFETISKQSEFVEHKNISKRIVKELKYLYVGQTAPEFTLKNNYDESHSLSYYSGNFLYLSFLSENSYTSKKELRLLEALSKEQLPGLQVLAIYVGKSFEEFKKFTQKTKYSFEFLFAPENSEVIKNYRVVSYPHYILINPEKKVTLISAPSPASNFRSVYGNYYIEWKREQIRRKGKAGSIVVPQ